MILRKKRPRVPNNFFHARQQLTWLTSISNFDSVSRTHPPKHVNPASASRINALHHFIHGPNLENWDRNKALQYYGNKRPAIYDKHCI